MLLFFLFNSVGVKAQHTSTLHRHESMHRHTHPQALSLFLHVEKVCTHSEEGIPKGLADLRGKSGCPVPRTLQTVEPQSGTCHHSPHQRTLHTTSIYIIKRLPRSSSGRQEYQGRQQTNKVINKLPKSLTDYPSPFSD